ncbi:MAG: type VI secretion system baseplate subunit TssE [Acetobacteraceae bacterium]|nr:type VI secretion system baseplate subunit TssE [Acetobacteraceae bacterium]
MSGRARGRADAVRAQLPLLDRLLDDAPDNPRDPPLSQAEALALLRGSVRRDLEALLNARRRWRSWPASLGELDVSPVGYGIPDFAAGAFDDRRRREQLREEVETAIRRFEPRLASLRVSLVDEALRPDATLRLRIEALLRVEPAPEPVAFDTVLDVTTADVTIRPNAEEGYRRDDL